MYSSILDVLFCAIFRLGATGTFYKLTIECEIDPEYPIIL